MLNLRKTNNILLILIITINAYLIFAPFYPNLYLWWQIHIDHQQQKLERVIRQSEGHERAAKNQPLKEGEWLVVPKLALDTRIYEGPTITTANQGVWHRPKSSTPDKNGNIVLAGHRFTYTQPQGIFYNLNKLSVGDEMALFWNGKRYTYKVSEIKVVPPSDSKVEADSEDNRLTLYTCTPLWSAKNRLVVTAFRSNL